jgi:GDP-mannose 6-dehydrogenase
LCVFVPATPPRDLELPLVENVLRSNERHLQRGVDAVVALDRRRVGVLGLSFKPGTDDLRESPMVELCERLIGKGFELKIYDPEVSLARLTGANREYIERRIPHVSALLTDTIQDVIDHAEVCVVGAAGREALEALETRNDLFIVDLVRPGVGSDGRERYVGLAW